MSAVYPTVGGLPTPNLTLDAGAGSLDTVRAAISAGDDDIIRNDRVRTGNQAVSVAPQTAQRYAISGGDVAFVQVMGIGTADNAVGHVLQDGSSLDDAIQASVKLDFTDHSGIKFIVISVGVSSVSVWGEV